MRALLAACVLLAGCAQPPRPAEPPLGPGEVRSARSAQAALAPGTTTKADVLAALGEGTVLDFATGYEVWVYREKPGGGELVLLFDPSGTLARTRVR